MYRYRLWTKQGVRFRRSRYFKQYTYFNGIPPTSQWGRSSFPLAVVAFLAWPQGLRPAIWGARRRNAAVGGVSTLGTNAHVEPRRSSDRGRGHKEAAEHWQKSQVDEQGWGKPVLDESSKRNGNKHIHVHVQCTHICWHMYAIMLSNVPNAHTHISY